MNEIKYYKYLKNNVMQLNEYNALSSISKGLMCVFFVFLIVGQVRCRSPPFINLIFKNSN